MFKFLFAEEIPPKITRGEIFATCQKEFIAKHVYENEAICFPDNNVKDKPLNVEELSDAEIIEKAKAVYVGCNTYNCCTIPALHELSNVETIFIGRGKLERVPYWVKFMHNLKTVILKSNKIRKIENIPSHLKKLVITDNEIEKIENLPKGLEVLELSNNKIKKIENLPKRLKILILDRNEIRKIENLPEGLEVLVLVGNKIEVIENLPKTLRVLLLKHNPLKESKYNIQYFYNFEKIDKDYEKLELLFINYVLNRTLNGIIVNDNEKEFRKVKMNDFALFNFKLKLLDIIQMLNNPLHILYLSKEVNDENIRIKAEKLAGLNVQVQNVIQGINALILKTDKFIIEKRPELYEELRKYKQSKNEKILQWEIKEGQKKEETEKKKQIPAVKKVEQNTDKIEETIKELNEVNEKMKKEVEEVQKDLKNKVEQIKKEIKEKPEEKKDAEHV